MIWKFNKGGKLIKILYLIIAINIYAFCLCYIDKIKSQKKAWRISERTLLLVSIFGGSIGFYLGMELFRHKTQKIKFKLGIPLIIILQAFTLYYLYFKNIISF